MPYLREEADADRIENIAAITDQPTEQNRYEIFCGSCAGVFYADKQSSEQFARAMEHDLDNQFLCEDCELVREEMAYAEH